jgi:hypothetical protein
VGVELSGRDVHGAGTTLVRGLGAMGRCGTTCGRATLGGLALFLAAGQGHRADAQCSSRIQKTPPANACRFLLDVRVLGFQAHVLLLWSALLPDVLRRTMRHARKRPPPLFGGGPASGKHLSFGRIISGRVVKIDVDQLSLININSCSLGATGMGYGAKIGRNIGL